MKFDLTPTQILCLLSYGENPKKKFSELCQEYGDETIYTDGIWLKEHGYLADNIKLTLSMTKQCYSTNVGNLPAFTEMGLESYNYYSSL